MDMAMIRLLGTSDMELEWEIIFFFDLQGVEDLEPFLDEPFRHL